MAIKSTPTSVERELESRLCRFKEQAASLKDGHRAARQKIQDDRMLSGLAKQTRIADLNKETRAKLDALRGEQESYVKGVRSRLEKELAGNQPTDASSVLLRRDAADRARKIVDEAEALSVLADATRGGDDTRLFPDEGVGGCSASRCPVTTRPSSSRRHKAVRSGLANASARPPTVASCTSRSFGLSV